MRKTKKDIIYYLAERPEIAIITNHGYAGPLIPTGGAPDTGGQNYYVNTLARKLEQQGYKITVYTRGGFPFYESTKIRSKTEYLTDNIRYVYIPGGGETFIRKEDIAIALDEELNWLYEYINHEAEIKKCEPWEVYEFINSHYWDAGVLGLSVVERWRNDMVEKSLSQLLSGIISEKELNNLYKERHWMSLGEKPSLFLGLQLLNQESIKNHDIQLKIRAAATSWASGKGLQANEENILVDAAEEALSRLENTFEPALKELVVASALGNSILMMSPESDDSLKRNLDRIDRHVWTPHSLGEIKDYNYRNRTLDVRRDLKFCERRNHERMICHRTRAIIATSTKIAEYLWTHFRVPVNETFYFPPCIDGDTFRPYTEQELNPTYKYMSKICGISVNKLKQSKIIFETSRMDHTKRKDLLIKAFGKIVSDYDDIYLFIGGGPKNELFNTLQNQISDIPELKGRAFLTAPIPDEHIGKIFSIAHIYASASEMEGFGMSVSQSAAAGVPIVSSDLIPYSLYYSPDHTEIFPAGNSVAFAKGIKKLLDNNDLWRKNSENLQIQAKSLNWEAKTKEFLDYLESKRIINNG